MSHSDEFIGQLEDYLETFDGTTPLPDRVRNAIRAELPSARQVRPRPGPLRIFTMLSNASPVARVGLVAATVVAAVVLGGSLLNNGRSAGIGGGGPTPTPTATPSPSPTPTPTPSPSPSAAAGPPELGAGTVVACDPADTAKSCLAPGTYQLTGASAWPVMVTFDLPAGWFEPGTTTGLGHPGTGWDAVLVQGGPPAYTGTGWGVVFSTVGDVSRDPCDFSKGTIPAAQVNTPQKLAAAIAAWPGFTTTAPKPITVDGHSALEFKVAKKANPGCAASGNAWLSSSGTAVDAYPFADGSAYPTTIRIVDTGKGLLVIRATDFPNTTSFETGAGVTNTPTRHAADQAKLRAILASIRITSWPASH